MYTPFLTTRLEKVSMPIQEGFLRYSKAKSRIRIVRRGKIVAQLHLMSTGKGKDVKAMLRRHRADPDSARDIAAVRELLEIETRP